ncbi:aspartyl protease family protein [Microbacterium sp. P01]|uniref:aspartyl protease family protein n=1 Tax=unclassified Microbacterium TaxID=2609290 RepID=UPI00366E2A2E
MGIAVGLNLDPDPDVAEAIVVSVLVDVDGVHQRLIVDTGGAQSALAAGELSRKLQSAPARSDAGRGVFGGNRRPDRVVAEMMAIGGLRIARPRFDVEALPGAPSLLGLDVLGEHRLDFLFSAAVLEFDGEGVVDHRRDLVQSSRRHPYVTANWGDIAANAIWDSGASISIVDRAFARRHSGLFRPEGNSSGIDASGVESNIEMVRMAGLTVGGRTFTPTIAGIADIAGIEHAGDPPFDLILGMPVLRQADWALDLADGWWGYRDQTR